MKLSSKGPFVEMGPKAPSANKVMTCDRVLETSSETAAWQTCLPDAAKQEGDRESWEIGGMHRPASKMHGYVGPKTGANSMECISVN